MKKIITALLSLVFCVALTGFGQTTTWQFTKVFPDTGRVFGTGVHGIAVDPDGKIWVGQGGTNPADTLPGGRVTGSIYVFNPNGTEAAFSRIKIINTPGASDTLTALCRGMRAMPNGNIAFVGIGGFVFEINYKTGVGVRKVNPVAPAVAAGIAPGFTSAGEMITGHVIGGNPIKIWDNTFGTLGTAVTASIGFSRTLEVSANGNDIFWCGYSTKRIYVYHSSSGTLGTYALSDSLVIGMQVESTGWHPSNGLLYVSSGTIDTADYGNPPVDPPWTPLTWYGLNTTTKAVTDSIKWNWAAYPYTIGLQGALAPRPRGIDFSVTGDTAYVATYNHAKSAIQMFRRVPTSVSPIDDRIPNGYQLSQNYPNPFNPSTEIEFAIPTAGFTTLKVYDVLGREVATLVNENLNPGTFKTRLDGSKLASGTYVYRLVSGASQITRKMMLLK